MAIQFKCPACWQAYSVLEQSAGRSAKCKACGSAIVVPGASAGPPKQNSPVAGKAAPPFICQSASDDAKRLTPRSVRWPFSKYAERAGLEPEKWHPHAARHGFATRLLFETSTPGGLFTVSRLLGHSSVSTTEIYLHINRGQLDQAVISDPLNGPW